MKVSVAKKSFSSKIITEIEIRQTPGKSGEWFLSVYADKGVSYILADENDCSISEVEINKLVDIARAIGFSEARIIF